jgi:Bacteriophytochrome (light-regulated signal transduction histidine kinase)
MVERVAANLTNCDLEPIHIPGSIQPHGAMIVADADGVVVGSAGCGEQANAIRGGRILDVLGLDPASFRQQELPQSGFSVLGQADWKGRLHDVIAFRSGGYSVLELTEAEAGSQFGASFLAKLESIATRLGRSITLADLANQTARIFQELTGFGRVMVYRFIDDEAGVVIGESITDGSGSFMNHHFPGSDIPRQARALYLRNRVRIIPDVSYTPVPIESYREDLSALDLSDSTLRSLSPVHIQYLKNMGVKASASMSIVKDGALWGMVACHHHEPRVLSLAARLTCQTVASAVARQIKMREEGDLNRERVRLRAQEDLIVNRLGSDANLHAFLGGVSNDLRYLLRADGFAAVQGDDVYRTGVCPEPAMVQAVARYARNSRRPQPFASSNLSAELAAAAGCKDIASGVVAVTMDTEMPATLLWFRAEKLQTLYWAGHPHKEDAGHEERKVLTPRASFETWAQQVTGRSEEWLDAEKESAIRLSKRMLDAWNTRRIHRLNQDLLSTLKKNESLIEQKDFLLKEVNHRVQNSLSIVSAFLRMQARNAEAMVQEQLGAAEQRLRAVGLVHRRLYQDNDVQTVDLGRYLSELVGELASTLDPRWRQHLSLDLKPIWIDPERTISIGLIVNELLTNSIKYAYNGEPGPIMLFLEPAQGDFRLTVADRGRGVTGGGNPEGTGFGSRVINALVERLNGTITSENNDPGLRTVLSVPMRG